MYKLYLYQDSRRQWRWRIVAKNGRVLADSGEGYSRRIDCRTSARRLFAGLQLREI